MRFHVAQSFGCCSYVSRQKPSRLVVTVFFLLFVLCELERTSEAQIQVVPDISTIAGNGTQGYSGDGGAASSAELHQPDGIAVDSAGNLYIADFFNQVIRKVAAGTGTISTVAGNGTAGYDGDGGPATSAALNQPYGLAVDGAGDLYIADFGNERVRKVAVNTGTITTVAGNGSLSFGPYGGSATSAALYGPAGVAVDTAGNLYIAQALNNVVVKVTASTGTINVVAGNGSRGYSGDGGAATSALLNQPFAVSVDSAGNLYIADTYNQRIRKIAAATGTITTVAGNGTSSYSGDGGLATSAELNFPDGVTVDGAGNLYIADSNNQVIRMVAAGTGMITTIAGNATQGFSGDGGAATGAELSDPFAVAIDSAGNLYIADSLNERIREVAVVTGSTLFPTTAVGSLSPTQTLQLQLDIAQTITSITAAKAQNGQKEYTVGAISGCTADGMTTNASGTICSVPLTFQPAYAGQRGGSLQVVTGAGTFSFGLEGVATAPQLVFTPGIITTVAGNGVQGYGGDGGAATSAELSGPGVVAVDSAGNQFIAELFNNRIRKVAAGTGTITTVVGTGAAGFSGDGGAATSAELDYPSGVDLDSAGNLYIADTDNSRVRKVDVSTGIITTLAGNGVQGHSGDGGPAASAELNQPGGVRVDNAGNVFIADTGNHVVRKVAAGTGTITTVAGNGTKGYSGDGGPATGAELHFPDGVDVDSAGDLFIADTNNNRIRKVDGNTGMITTVAGNGAAGYSGDGGPATSAELYSPYVVWLDIAGNLYIADTNNQVIRKVDAGTGTIGTVAGTGTLGYSGDGGAATSAELNLPFGVALDGPGNLYITDFGNDRIRKVDVADPPPVSFDATYVGATSSDSPRTLEIGNIGNQPLAFSSNPSYPANFPANSANTALCSSSAPLNPGMECDVSMSFLPTAVGVNSGSVMLTDDTLNASAAMQSIPLSGTGIAAIFTLAATSNSATTTAGSTATYSLTLAPASGTIPDPVTMSATGLPAGATATFSPATIPAGSGATTIMLTIQTRSTQTARNDNPDLPWIPVALGFLVLPLVRTKPMRRRLRQLPFFLLLLAAAALSLGATLGLSGCGNNGGSSSSSQASTSYPVVATATDATRNAQSSTNLTLTVK